MNALTAVLAVLACKAALAQPDAASFNKALTKLKPETEVCDPNTNGAKQAPDFDRVAFCASPASVICDAEAKESYFKAKNVEYSDIEDKALVSTASEFDFDQSYEAFDRLKKENPEKWGKAYAYYLKKIEKRVFSKLNLKEATLSSALEGVKSRLKAAIDRQARLSAPVREKMKEKVNKARIQLASEAAEHDAKAAYGLCYSRSDKNEKWDSAEYNPKTDTITLCPGLLMLGHSNKQLASITDPLLNIAETVAHELGHAIDSSVFPKDLWPVQACLRDVHGLEATPKDPVTMKLGLSQIDPEAMDELSADFWSAETMAEYLKGKKPQQAFVALREAYHFYCSGSLRWKKGDKHLPPAARLSLLLGENPTIREIMGCAAPTKAKPSCTIAGQVP